MSLPKQNFDGIAIGDTMYAAALYNLQPHQVFLKGTSTEFAASLLSFSEERLKQKQSKILQVLKKETAEFAADLRTGDDTFDPVRSLLVATKRMDQVNAHIRRRKAVGEPVIAQLRTHLGIKLVQ